MKLIIVDRSKPETFARLTRTFADEINVQVVWQRRTRQRRSRVDARGPERRSRERREFSKGFGGRDYVVIHLAKK